MKPVIFFDVDTQYDFINSRGRLYVKGARKLIPNLKRLTHFASKGHIPIVSSTDAHIKTDSEFKVFPTHCTRGSRGQKKISYTLLRRRTVIRNKKYSKSSLLKKIGSFPQVIIEKQNLDVFSNPNTRVLLKDVKVACVYGVVTEYCVKSAVEGLLRLKKEVYLVTDAIKEVSRKEAKKTLASFKRRGVKFVTTKRLLERTPIKNT